ncbi:MAG: LodA/GoxA family CTQ-dependent oxidase [Saprospiraceae bacterium]|nr:LodA/GoxA family CTQ-dependent oxidase [Saprospiraceae bacterium]
MSTQYSIHPAIGIARVGDSEQNHFYLPPAQLGQMPVECDEWGNVKTAKDGHYPTIKSFRDKDKAILRQGAQFKVYMTDKDGNSQPLVVKDAKKKIKGTIVSGATGSGELIDIIWTVHLANKKSAWYDFEQTSGEHGYAEDHPLRNPEITNDIERNRLIIDPGPQTVRGTRQKAAFKKGENPLYAQTFPPDDTKPYFIETLGEIRTSDSNALTVLGGHGFSGSINHKFPHPLIETYANNDGWFDDTSDGPVTAMLAYYDEQDQQVRYIRIEDPSWVIVGYPRYAPEIPDLITINDVIYDLSVKHFAYKPYLYGTQDDFKEGHQQKDVNLDSWRIAQKRYNPDYYPKFYEEIWPLISRPAQMWNVTSYLGQSYQPHSTGQGGNFYMEMLATPPPQPSTNGPAPDDPNYYHREKIFMSLRQPGEENVFYRHYYTFDEFQFEKPLMPLLAGDNPITNELPSKFLRLTDTQLYILRQWRDGKFINEKEEGIYHSTKDSDMSLSQIDQATLDMGLGGAFCPGGEVAWIIRNPAIYRKAYRINADQKYLPSMQTNNVTTTPGLNLYEAPGLKWNNNIDDGLQPGDITKYSALPWQADFNECSTQDIDVTYDQWNKLSPNSAYEKSIQTTNMTLWWPAHRPLQVFLENGHQAEWSRGIPANKEGDYKMVIAWKWLGFVMSETVDGQTKYVEKERVTDKIGDYETFEEQYPQKK